MSTLWAPLAQPGAGQAAGQRKDGRRLRAVPPLPARVARVPFITVLIAIFGVGMVGLLVVNTTLQNQAFESRALTRQAAQLTYQEAELQSQLDRMRAPAQIAAKASALGMRANPHPAFLVVPSGKVIGERHRVDGTEMRGLIVKTPQQRAAEKAAKVAQAQAKAAAAARKKAEEAAKKAAAEAKASAAAKQRAAQAAKKKSQQSGGN